MQQKRTGEHITVSEKTYYKDENPGYYAVIPAPVRYDNRLAPRARLLYGEITALCNKKGYCWATNDYFAKLYKVSIQTVSGWISSLKKCGYVNVSMKYREDSLQIEERQITLIPIKENFNGYTKNPEYPIKENTVNPIKENFKDNITSNTTLNNTLNNIEDEVSPHPPTRDFNEDEQIVKQSGNKNNGARRPRLGAAYGHAKFTDEEWKQLQKDFPTDYLEWVRKIDEYCERQGREYNNYYLTIKNWAERDKEKAGKLDMSAKRNIGEPFSEFSQYKKEE